MFASIASGSLARTQLKMCINVGHMHVVCLSVYGGKSHTPHIYIHIYAMHTPLPVAFTRVFVLVVIVLEYELLWQHENQNKTV